MDATIVTALALVSLLAGLLAGWFAASARAAERSSAALAELTARAVAAEAGVRAMEAFYRRIGMPATLGELGLTLTEAQIDTLAEKCTFFGTRTIGQFRQLGYEDIRAIYRAAR